MSLHGEPHAEEDNKVMKGECKSIVNAIKAFLGDMPCALWFLNANEDQMCMFGGPHFHVVAFTGHNAIARDLSHYESYSELSKITKKSHKCYIKQQRVRNLGALLKHFMLPPRVFIDSCDTVTGSMVQSLNQQSLESFRADEHLEDVQYSPKDEPSNDEWSAYKLDLTDCVDVNNFEDNDDMFHTVHTSLFDAHYQFKCGNRKRGQDFADDSDLFADLECQTITNSMSSLKTTMKDRLLIVMRNIYTYYDAYSFEEL